MMLPPPPQRSLLRKLLSKDVERETSMVLQCVRYIVRNHFFDRLPGAPVSASAGAAGDTMEEKEEGGAAKENEGGE